MREASYASYAPLAAGLDEAWPDVPAAARSPRRVAVTGSNPPERPPPAPGVSPRPFAACRDAAATDRTPTNDHADHLAHQRRQATGSAKNP